MKNAQDRLLVVDDNEMNRDMLSRRLARDGYRVTTAEDGDQTLVLLQTERFDLILLDVEMPGLSGFEVLQRIRQKYSLAELPVIMATARDTSQDMIVGFQNGANDYVTKPIDFPVLLVRIQTQLQLKALAKLKDEFLQIASHDLKNPLGNVLMAAGLIVELVPPGETMTEEMHEMLSMITNQAKTMQRIIIDFLDFQALQDGQMRLERKAIQLNALADKVAAQNADYAVSKQIELHLSFAEQLPELMADESRLEQVIQNFVGNAIKFCPAEATVLVSTHLEDHTQILEVSDSGPGLTESALEKAFTKYAKLGNKPTGGEKSSGVGLAICKQIIELHGGKVGVRNNPNQGATFWFSLPLAATT
jgi:two-component system sensor histidine kinase/response regulator